MPVDLPYSGAVEVIAHRGFSAVAPENTLAAFDAAVQAGADAIEFDVHAAGDGTPVVFHDAMLSRTTNGVGPIRRRTLEQLKKLDAGSWFAPEFAGERIPSLREALGHIGDRTGRIYAEIKGFRELEDIDRMLRVAEEVEQLQRTVFISMNWTVLDRLRSRRPDVAIGYVVDEADKLDEAIGRAGGDPRALVDARGDLVDADPSVIHRAAAADTEVAVWSLDEEAQAQRAYDLGVRRITTNEVARLMVWKTTL